METLMRDFSAFFQKYGWPENKGRLPFCIGHRGASGHERENTLTAFRRAAELGAEMWELDTQMTSDGVVVVSHDDHLQRVFQQDLHISQMTFAELREAVPDVPSFAEVAALGRETGCGLYVELKRPGTGPLCWQHLKDMDQRFACLGSFDTAQVCELREMGCDYPLSVLIRVGHDPHAAGEMAGADILHLCWEKASDTPQEFVTEDLIDRAFAEGKEIVLWHEERPDVLKDIMVLPVLGICTDLPDLMRPRETSGMSREQRRVTSFDVARAAGVSRAAVSRAFTPDASVSEKTRQKVYQAAKELGYRVNYLARSLTNKRSDFVGLVAAGLDNPFRTQQLENLARALIARNYRPILLPTSRRRTAPPSSANCCITPFPASSSPRTRRPRTSSRNVRSKACRSSWSTRARIFHLWTASFPMTGCRVTRPSTISSKRAPRSLPSSPAPPSPIPRAAVLRLFRAAARCSGSMRR